jgi:hypothetical protein
MIQGPPPFGLDPNLVLHLTRHLIELVVVFLGLRWLFRSPVGEAIGERIRMRARWRRGAVVGAEDPQRMAALEEQVAHLQGEVSELAERLDFAERLLAERRERKLGAGP